LLKVTTAPAESCEMLMTVELDEREADKLLKAAAQRISRQVRIPGFRPGKVPYQTVVRRVGEEAIRAEALEDLSQKVFKQALEQAQLEPYAQASLEEVTWDPLVLKVRVPTPPVVELGDYGAMRLEIEPVQVSEAEINQALEGLQKSRTNWKPVERPAQLGDRLVMAVKEQAGDQILTEDEDVRFELEQLPEDSRGPDLTTPLLGLATGDEREFRVTYPPDASDPRYAGKEVSISVKADRVEEGEIYPLDDDFAQMVGDFDTLEELKQNVSDDLRRQKQREADAELGQQALEKLIEGAPRVEWPKALEEEEIDRALEERDRRLQQSGLSLDTYLGMQKKTRDELREELRPAVRQRLRRSLVLSKLIELEDLSISGHEVSGQIDRLSLLAGERSTDVRQALTRPDSVRYIANDLLTAKVVERLAQIVKGEIEVGPETNVEKEAEEENTGKQAVVSG